MMTLIRHAPTGLHGVYVGHSNVACVLPESMHMHETSPLFIPDAEWFSSDLSRAVDTSQWIRNHLNISKKNTTHPALREQNFGAWEGQNYDDIYAHNPQLGWDNPATLRAPEGENFVDVMARVGVWIPTIMHHKHTVIIAHAGSIRAIIAHALSLTPAQALRLTIDTGNISCVNFYDNVGVIQFLNRPLLVQSTAGTP